MLDSFDHDHDHIQEKPLAASESKGFLGSLFKNEPIEVRVGKLEARCEQIEERTKKLDTSRAELEADWHLQHWKLDTTLAERDVRLASAERKCAVLLEEHESTTELTKHLQSRNETWRAELEARMASAERKCAELLEAETVEKLGQRMAEVEQRAAELLKAKERGEQLVEEAKAQIMEAHDSIRAEMQLEFVNIFNAEKERWQEDLKQNVGAEVEKLKKNMDLDPIWKSFAHVDSIIGPLQKRMDEMEKMMNQRKGVIISSGLK